VKYNQDMFFTSFMRP